MDDALRLVVVEVGARTAASRCPGPAHDLQAPGRQALELFDVAVVEPEPYDGLQLGRSHAHSPSTPAAPSAALNRGRSRCDVLDIRRGGRQHTRPSPGQSPASPDRGSSSRRSSVQSAGPKRDVELGLGVSDAGMVTHERLEPLDLDHARARSRSRLLVRVAGGRSRCAPLVVVGTAPHRLEHREKFVLYHRPTAA